MCHLRTAIQHQFGIETGKSVILRSERNIVIGREILEMDPALPSGNKRAIFTTSLQLAKDIIYLLPG